MLNEDKNSIIQYEHIKFDMLGAYVSTLCQIEELQFIHKKKFGINELETQKRKFFEEIDEYMGAKKEKDQVEELMDVIISAVGLCNSYGVNLREELKKKLKKVVRATYKDNHHVGDYK